MISDPVYPRNGTQSLSKSISDELLAYEAHRVDEHAANGYGIDGMPLHPGQTGPTRRACKGEPNDALLQALIQARKENHQLREENRQLREALEAAEAQKKELRKCLALFTEFLDQIMPGWRESLHADP